MKRFIFTPVSDVFDKTSEMETEGLLYGVCKYGKECSCPGKYFTPVSDDEANSENH